MELGEFFSRLRGEREREQGERLTIVQIERELDGLILGNSLSALHKGLTEKANFYYVCLLCEYYGVTPNDAWNAVRDDFIKEKHDQRKDEATYNRRVMKHIRFTQGGPGGELPG